MPTALPCNFSAAYRVACRDLWQAQFYPPHRLYFKCLKLIYSCIKPPQSKANKDPRLFSTVHYEIDFFFSGHFEPWNKRVASVTNANTNESTIIGIITFFGGWGVLSSLIIHPCMGVRLSWAAVNYIAHRYYIRLLVSQHFRMILCFFLPRDLTLQNNETQWLSLTNPKFWLLTRLKTSSSKLWMYYTTSIRLTARRS